MCQREKFSVGARIVKAKTEVKKRWWRRRSDNVVIDQACSEQCAAVVFGVHLGSYVYHMTQMPKF
jgi:hypothetical protein